MALTSGTELVELSFDGGSTYTDYTGDFSSFSWTGGRSSIDTATMDTQIDTVAPGTYAPTLSVDMKPASLANILTFLGAVEAKTVVKVRHRQNGSAAVGGTNAQTSFDIYITEAPFPAAARNAAVGGSFTWPIVSPIVVTDGTTTVTLGDVPSTVSSGL